MGIDGHSREATAAGTIDNSEGRVVSLGSGETVVVASHRHCVIVFIHNFETVKKQLRGGYGILLSSR